MKKVIIILTLIIAIISLTTIPADAATSDKTIVKSYCQKYYPDKSIKYVKANSSIIKHRKGKNYVVVECLNTTAKGDYKGKYKKYTVRYTKKEKKGKKVKVYLIYNPNNNCCDDIVAVIDHKQIK